MSDNITNPTPVDTAALAAGSGIPLMDEKDALKRLGGNKNLYKKLLKSFMQDQVHAGLAASITAGDMEKARYAAHSIKGMAANLSLKALSHDVAALEVLLKAGTIDRAVYQTTQQTFENTKAAIEKFMSDAK